MARPRKGCLTACKIFVVVVVMSLSLYGSESFYPHTVKNHVVVDRDLLIDRFPAQDWISCIMSCQNDPRCFSYNYQYEKKENGLCELYECGVKQDQELTKDLVYSYGFLFQQLKIHKRMKRCCREGWTGHEFHCYKVIEDEKDWEGASLYCKSIGANLASVHSKEEMTFIKDTIQNRSVASLSHYFRIGANYKENGTDDCRCIIADSQLQCHECSDPNINPFVCKY